MVINQRLAPAGLYLCALGKCFIVCYCNLMKVQSWSFFEGCLLSTHLGVKSQNREGLKLFVHLLLPIVGYFEQKDV